MWPYTLTVSLTSVLCTISVSPFGNVLTTGCSVDGGTSSRASALAAHGGRVGGGQAERRERLGSPGGERGPMGLTERDRFVSAEASAARHRPARAARQHHAGDGVGEVEGLARDAIHVRDGYLLHAFHVLVGRVE